MKKLLFILSCVAIANLGVSQSTLKLATLNNLKTATVTAITNGINLNEATTISTTSQTKIRIYNTSASTQTYNLIRTDEVLNSGASAYFCIDVACYPPSTTSLNVSNLLVIPTGTFENNFTVDIDEATTVGLSVIRYKIFNVNNLNDTLTFKTSYNAPATSLNENQNPISSIDIYPSPAIDFTSFKINSSRNADAKLEIYNSLGSVVSTKNISLIEGKNKVDYNVENLSSGIYFASIKMGTSTTTKKFIVK